MLFALVQCILNLSSLVLHFELESSQLVFSVPQILFLIAMIFISSFTFWRNSKTGWIIYTVLSLSLWVLIIFFEWTVHRDKYTERYHNAGAYLLNSIYLGNNIVLIVLSLITWIYFYSLKNVIVHKAELHIDPINI